MTVRSIPMARPCREHSTPLHLRCHFAWLPAFGRDWVILLAVIGVYFLGSVQLFFIGILGEYIGSIQTQIHHRPLVIEKERINFD